MNKFNNVNIAKPTLLRGKDVEDFTESEFLMLIREINKEIEGYADITGSTKIDAKVAQLQADLKEITGYLDAL